MAQKRTWTKSAFAECYENGEEKEIELSEKRRTLITPPPTKCQLGDMCSWIEIFAPSNNEDLAVHAKKVAECQEWFETCNLKLTKNPICLLSGPSGAGKTATIRALATEFQYSIQEWVNPVDVETVHAIGDQDFNGYAPSQLGAFESFLLRASRYRSLQDKFNKRLILVEDFPNSLISDAASFEEMLSEYKSYGRSPLVFIVADSKFKTLNISYNLFSDELKQKFQIKHISFNPVATTLMQKAVKRFCTLMRQQKSDIYEIPTQKVIDSLVVCAQGDIRNLLVNFHFSALKGAPSLQTKLAAAKPSKTKSKQKSRCTLKSVGRDESLTMMHALGRVFNPKITENQRLSHDPEEISEAFSTEPHKFTRFIHANYVQHFRSIEDIATAADGLSLADLMLADYYHNELACLGLKTAVRSVMVANKQPASGWLPVRGLKRTDTLDNNEFHNKELLGETVISKDVFAVEYSGFLKMMSVKLKL